MLFSIQRYFGNISKAGNVLRRLQNDVYRRNMIILTVKIRIRRLSVVPSKVLLRLEEVYSRGKATMSKSGLHWEPSGPPLVNVREGPEGWKGGPMMGRVVARRADGNRRRSERNGCCSSSPLYKRLFNIYE